MRVCANLLGCLILLTALAGCVTAEDRAGDRRFSGAYGGISGGAAPGR